MLALSEAQPPVAGSDIRHTLRAGTREAHERLDALVGDLDTVERYGDFLAGLHAFRAPVEHALADAAWPEQAGDWRPRLAASSIEADLAHIGRPAQAWQPLDMSKDIETLLGVSYVLEGSALGARLLVRQAAALGFDEAGGAVHLSEQAADIGHWRAFIDLLGRLGPLDLDRMIEAANDSFARATAAMEPARRG